tara:strand:+ start:188 stop:733 length:546 start_codon:yes stop_codon:yes gene_type:complete
MNKIKFLAIFVFMALLTVTSCSEDNEAVNSYDENAIAKQLSFVDVDTRIANKQSKGIQSRVKIIIVSWDEWGRASRLCRGWGLCNADWFPYFKRTAQKSTSTNGGATLLEFDDSLNKFYIDILLAETPPTEIPTEALTLKIDENFELEVEDAISQNLTFNQGDYSYDDSLGEFGGYRIYLD